MHLTALSAGYAVPTADFDAAIHSVFHLAVNLLPSNGDLLLSLVAASEADLPQGVRVATPVSFSFDNLRVGERVACRDGLLTFENAALTIDFAHARRWECDLPALGVDMANPAVAAVWNGVWQVLNERQKRMGADIVAEILFCADETAQSPISRRVGEAARALIEATQRYDSTTASSSVGALIGLGTGLTPSGDDFLVGYLVGLWCTVLDANERRQFVSNLGKAIIRLSRRTNDISRTYLYHAGHGQISSRLEFLAGAICRAENPEQLLTSAESAMQNGHSSGMDAVTGLLVGLAAWETLDYKDQNFVTAFSSTGG